ncbi:MAG: amidohydrolase family protein [Acidimicrobiales bacterium]|nr:amidohydrolase family protein [Acidimicrobiales bacterium]
MLTPDDLDSTWFESVLEARHPGVRERVWVSCEPDERMIPALVDRYGDRFLWASDFPHIDHSPDYIDDLDELAGLFDDESRARFLGGNARDLFSINA